MSSRLEPLRQAQVEAQDVARHLDARRDALLQIDRARHRARCTPSAVVPCWMSLTSLCGASAKYVIAPSRSKRTSTHAWTTRDSVEPWDERTS